MAKRFLILALAVASFAAVAPAAQVYGRGYGGRVGVRGGVYAAPRSYYGPRGYVAPVIPYAPYVAPYAAPYPAYPTYSAPYYGYGLGLGYGYGGGRYYGGGGYRGGGYSRGYRGRR